MPCIVLMGIAVTLVLAGLGSPVTSSVVTAQQNVSARALNSRVAPSRSTPSAADVPLAEVPRVTDVLLTTTPLVYPPAGAVRTVRLVTLPAGAPWETEIRAGSLLLTVASGGVQITINEGTARIVSRSGTGPSQMVAPGVSVLLLPGDRLHMQGRGSLLARNVTQDPVVAAVIRVQ
jgi:hypothetical protein